VAGTVDIVEQVSTGIETEGDILSFNPELPPEPEKGHHLVGTRADGCGKRRYVFLCKA